MMKMKQDLLGLGFEMDDGTTFFLSAQEMFELLTFVVELKKSSEKRRREVLGE